jgi:hypothetical protein
MAAKGGFDFYNNIKFNSGFYMSTFGQQIKINGTAQFTTIVST